jgi:putative nucleotidyltransferase with HDIG domain
MLYCGIHSLRLFMNSGSYDDRYRRFVEKMDQIPSLPSIVSRLIRVVNSSESSAEDVADLIEKDPALTSKVLRLANSAFYGIPRSVSSVQSAVVILGFNTLKSIVLSASAAVLFSSMKEPQVFDKSRFWKHSIVCALAAKTIAQRMMNKIGIDPESAFCAGIMHDVGKLIFELFSPQEYRDLCQRSLLSSISLVEAEVVSMNIDHAEIGRILADKWALPIDLEYAIVFHHQPQGANKMKELVSLVHIADAITHQLDCGLWDNEKAPVEWKGARTVLSIDDDHYTRIVDVVREEIDNYQEFLSIIKG